MNKKEKEINRKKNKIALLGLFLIFLSPILVSYYLASSSEETREFKNNGFLINPPRALPDIELYDVYEKTKKPLYGKWNLVFVNEGECLEQCKENLYKIRQIRLAIGKHDHRVQRVVIFDKVQQELHKRVLTNDYKGQLILSKEEVDTGFIDAFKFSDDEDLNKKNRVYIIDPIGNLMMSYEAGADPIGIIEDLRVLIRASRIG